MATKTGINRIRNASPSTNRKDLRSFSGLSSYYRNFIKGFAKIAHSLTEKTSESVKFEWTEDMDKAFESLKTALTTAPVLIYPDYEKPFIVATDTSNTAVGAVGSQLDEDGRENPIQYASRTSINVEKNYSAFEREASGVVLALKRFRYYLLCQYFKLYNDYEALKLVLQIKDSHRRIARRMTCLLSSAMKSSAVPETKI